MCCYCRWSRIGLDWIGLDLWNTLFRRWGMKGLVRNSPFPVQPAIQTYLQPKSLFFCINPVRAVYQVGHELASVPSWNTLYPIFVFLGLRGKARRDWYTGQPNRTGRSTLNRPRAVAVVSPLTGSVLLLGCVWNEAVSCRLLDHLHSA